MMKSIIFILIILLAGWLPASEENFNCFTIAAGKQATADSSVLVAHNEDDRGRLQVNIYKVAAREHRPDDATTMKSGSVLPQVGAAPGLLWIEIPENDFADAYVNEFGVTVTSNSCPSREDKPDLTNGGIGFSLRRLVAERAQTARDGVRIAGELISQYGYTGSGRTYIIADSSECWFLHAVNGKHWVAKRVPDNEVAVIANRFTIDRVDLSDRNNFLGSPDIIEYAVRRSWYHPEKDGPFHFARAYSQPDSYVDARNVMRQWQGTNLLAAKGRKLEDTLPFSFKPRRNLRLNDLFRVLRDHYEGSKYDSSNHYKNGSPNSGKNRTICTESTQYAFVAHLRGWLPPEIAHLVWICLRRPDSNAFSPWYVSMNAAPDGYSRLSADNAMKNHFAPLPAQAFEDSSLAFNTFAKVSETVDRQYRGRIEKTQKVWRNFEDFLFNDLKNHEKEFIFLLKSNKALARKIIDNYIHGLEYRKWFLAGELLKEFRK